MCLAIPGRIIEAEGAEGLVDFQGNRFSVSLALTPDARVDDWVLVHAGFAIARIDEEDARETWFYLNRMDDLAKGSRDAGREGAHG